MTKTIHNKSVSELSTTAFPDSTERAEFLSRINSLNNRQGLIWYWYGIGANGKSVLADQLTEEYGPSVCRWIPSTGDRPPPFSKGHFEPSAKREIREEDNAFMINGNTIIMCNKLPDLQPNELITYFRETFIHL